MILFLCNLSFSSFVLLLLTSNCFELLQFLSRQVLNVNKTAIPKEMQESVFWELLIQPFFGVIIILFFTKTLNWLSCNRECSIKKNCGGPSKGPRHELCPSPCRPCLKKCIKGDEREMADLREEMVHERLNITLNIFEEDQRDGVVDSKRQHKLHMRTINEGPLLGDNGCFGGKWDNLIFKILLRDNEPWNLRKNEYAPFLQTSPLREMFWENNKFDGAKIVKQMRDQIVNRLSMLFGSAFIAQDQGLQYVSKKYIFGITYEERDKKSGTRPKCRVLVMQEESLRRMATMWRDDPMTFHFPCVA